jgi:hypothetical protein
MALVLQKPSKTRYVRYLRFGARQTHRLTTQTFEDLGQHQIPWLCTPRSSRRRMVQTWTRTDGTQWHMQPHGLGDISMQTKLAYKIVCNSGTSEGFATHNISIVLYPSRKSSDSARVMRISELMGLYRQGKVSMQLTSLLRISDN